MRTLTNALLLLPMLTACGTALESSRTSSERNFPQPGTINEFGQIKINQTTSRSYSLEVTPFVRSAIYKIVISESTDSASSCAQYSNDATQVLKIEKKNLKPDFLHFVRVCVYFDEGDSGATSLVLANDKLLVGISQETLKFYR
ncbi:MAG: hypothetical protein RI932_673 [Pseudomonadota bacterium]|jgi:hypothetical protein